MGISLNIGTGDPQRLGGFYRALWGDPLFEGAGYASWQLGESLVTVGPHDQVRGPNADPGRFLLGVIATFSDPDGNYIQIVQQT